MKIDVKGSLQSWLDNIIVNAIISESFRCVLAGKSASECGKKFLLKNLFLSVIQFDKLYIIGPTGDPYEDLKNKDIVFIWEIKYLPSPDQLPNNMKKLMIFNDVGVRNQLLMNTFVEVDIVIVIWYILNKIYSRQKVRENCNLFIPFEQRSGATTAIYHDFFKRAELSYDDFSFICEKVWQEPYKYIVIEKSKNRNINGKLRINWDWRNL